MKQVMAIMNWSSGELCGPWASCLFSDFVIKAAKSENKKGFLTSEKALISSRVNKFY